VERNIYGAMFAVMVYIHPNEVENSIQLVWKSCSVLLTWKNPDKQSQKKYMIYLHAVFHLHERMQCFTLSVVLNNITASIMTPKPLW